VLSKLVAGVSQVVMPGLVQGIHVLTKIVARKTWMAGTSPAMTNKNTSRRNVDGG
jgi:hypothetical protein